MGFYLQHSQYCLHLVFSELDGGTHLAQTVDGTQSMDIQIVLERQSVDGAQSVDTQIVLERKSVNGAQSVDTQIVLGRQSVDGAQSVDTHAILLGGEHC